MTLVEFLRRKLSLPHLTNKDDITVSHGGYRDVEGHSRPLSETDQLPRTGSQKSQLRRGEGLSSPVFQ